MIIFECNGVLVDSEPAATAVVTQEFARRGIRVTPEAVAEFSAGRMDEMFRAVEAATGRALPAGFGDMVATATLRRFRSELRPIAHVHHALTWLRGSKCAVSLSSLDRIRLSLDATGLLHFFEPDVFSAAEMPDGKRGLFLHIARTNGVRPQDCVVVDDSPDGVAAAHGAGMLPIGFAGASRTNPHLGTQLTEAGARAILVDMRALKSTVAALRGY